MCVDSLMFALTPTANETLGHAKPSHSNSNRSEGKKCSEKALITDKDGEKNGNKENGIGGVGEKRQHKPIKE